MLSHPLPHLKIKRLQPIPDVDQEDSELRLRDDIRGHVSSPAEDATGGGGGLEPGGVEHAEPEVAELGEALADVAGDVAVGGVVNQRLPPSYQSIEEGGLADVGAADEDNGGEVGRVEIGEVYAGFGLGFLAFGVGGG